MTKLLVLLTGIVWACLLLISWGGAEVSARQPAATAAGDTAR